MQTTAKPIPAAMTTLLEAATARRSLILVPPKADRVGALALWPTTQAELVASLGGLPPRQVLAITWASRTIGAQLQVVDCDRWTELRVGTPAKVPPVDLSRRIELRTDGPRAVLEAVALAVRFDLSEVRIAYVRNPGEPAEERRLARIRLRLPGLLVVHDLDRDAPRSFRLDRITRLELEDRSAAPRWVPGMGYEVAR